MIRISIFEKIKVMQRYLSGKFIVFLVAICAAAWSFAPLQKLALSFTFKTLKKGKYVTSTGEVYYNRSGGMLITYFDSPAKNIVFANEGGNVKIYDLASNQFSENQDQSLSSNKSFIHLFINGQAADLGLKAEGFKLVKSKVENKQTITEWESGRTKAELVHENFLPIFLGFYNSKKIPSQKIYYSNYRNISGVKLPLTITEISYDGKDSVITKKMYSNERFNEQVDDKKLSFTIPKNAKLIQPAK